MPALRALATLWLAWAPAALAAPIAPIVPTATSSYPTENGVSYGPRNLLDGKVGSCWIEGDRGAGLGASVQLDLGAEHEVRAVRIWNGNQASTDLWQRHNRVKALELSFSDGSKAPFTLPDSQDPQVLTLPKPVTTTFVKLRLTSVYAGTTFGDTPIAELQVLDGAPDDHAVPVSVKASTTYPADADATYGPERVADGMADTAWCEGDRQGDGTGQWLALEYAAPVTVARLRFVNGAGGTDEENAAANRPTSAKLTFDDGSTAEVTLAPGAAPQDIPIPPHTTRTVRVTFTGVAKGTTYDDMCVAELVLAP